MERCWNGDYDYVKLKLITLGTNLIDMDTSLADNVEITSLIYHSSETISS